ncbi:hypothetical protein HMPREF3198_00663 [Winkia neuii]|nr:hypothetical protein HMPREF3198_00663 [Winkia neuii]
MRTRLPCNPLSEHTPSKYRTGGGKNQAGFGWHVDKLGTIVESLGTNPHLLWIQCGQK